MDRDEIEMDLNEIDEQILDVLEDGRATRKFIADELEKTGEYIYQRVDVLIRLGIVEKIHDGFYQLAQEEQDEEPVDQTTAEESLEETPREPVKNNDELPATLEQRLDEYREKMEANGDRRADDRVAAARAIMSLMISEGGVQKSDAVDELLPEFAVDGQNETTWWRKNGKDLLGEVAEWDQSLNKYVFRD